MKFEILYVPTSDLTGSLTLYRDHLGFTEMWREGDTTVALTAPDSDFQVMLDASAPDAPGGPMFAVDRVVEFHATRPDALTVLDEPAEIPGGFLAVYQEPGGGVIYVIDQSTDAGTA